MYAKYFEEFAIYEIDQILKQYIYIWEPLFFDCLQTIWCFFIGSNNTIQFEEFSFYEINQIKKYIYIFGNHMPYSHYYQLEKNTQLNAW